MIEQLGIDDLPHAPQVRAAVNLKVMRGATTGDASWPE